MFIHRSFRGLYIDNSCFANMNLSQRLRVSGNRFVADWMNTGHMGLGLSCAFAYSHIHVPDAPGTHWFP